MGTLPPLDMSEVVARTASEAEMIEAGRALADSLAAGDVVALNGELGAGKTRLAQGIAAGLGVREDVTSPTFALVHEFFSGRLPLFHFDFYRIDAAAELEDLGWDDYLDEGGVVIVEWAEKFPELLPPEARRLDLTVADDGHHVVTRR